RSSRVGLLAPSERKSRRGWGHQKIDGTVSLSTRHGVRGARPADGRRLTTPMDSGRIAARWQGRYPRCAKRAVTEGGSYVTYDPSEVMRMTRMRGALALVTGAGSGIGRAPARRFAAEGARVACGDRAAAAADETARAIKADGGEAFGLGADVTDETACGRMVAAAVERFGGLTTLVNSAGVGPQRE